VRSRAAVAGGAAGETVSTRAVGAAPPPWGGGGRYARRVAGRRPSDAARRWPPPVGRRGGGRWVTPSFWSGVWSAPTAPPVRRGVGGCGTARHLGAHAVGAPAVLVWRQAAAADEEGRWPW